MNYLLHIIVMLGIYLPWALGYNLVFGRGKILHFGHEGMALFIVYGMYLTLRSTDQYILAFLAGLLCAALISSLFAWLALRLESDAFGILSIAMHAAVLAVVLNWTSVTRGALGLPQIPRMTGLSSLPAFALFSATIGVLAVTIASFIDRSRLGRALGALAENKFHAEALGISRKKVYHLAFFIEGIALVVTSIIFPQYIGLVHPNDYRFDTLVSAIMIVVAGGSGSVRGVTIATILIVLLKESLRFVSIPFGLLGPVRLILFGLILIVAVYMRRGELFPKPRTV